MRTSKLLFGLLLSLTACTKIQIKDIPVYWDAGPDGAVVANLLSDTEATLPKEQWDKERIGMGCISQSDYGWVKATLEKFCGELPRLCTDETKQVMKKFFARSERIASRLKR